MNKNPDYGPTLLRFALGMIFVIPGLQKLAAPEGIIGMLTNLGFPAPAFMGWLLIFSEVIFGALIFVGWKINYAVWPPAVILAVATATVHIPAFFNQQPMAAISVLMHVLGIAALISLYLTGPGKLTLKRINLKGLASEA